MPPRWLGHALNFAGLVRRYGTNWFFPEIWSGIIPTVQVDKHYPSDVATMFGMRTEILTDGVNYAAMMLQAGDVDVLVHKVEWWVDSDNNGDTEGIRLHLFTPLPNYQPCDVANPVYAWYPWLLGSRFWGSLGELPEAYGFSGHAAALPQISIGGGAPFNTIGPQQKRDRVVTAAVGGGGGATRINYGYQNVWTFQDPAFRMQPWTRMCLQKTTVGGANRRLIANWYYTVRRPQGYVG